MRFESIRRRPGRRMRLANARSDARSGATPLEILLALLIALLAFALANAASATTGFNPDESRWISRAHYLADLRDPFGPTWDDQYMTRGQPPLGSYAMGAALLLQGRDLETNPPWDFSLPWEENIAVGNRPSPDDLAAGRRASAVLVALTSLTIIGITRVFVAMPWALLAGLLIAVHPFTTYIGSIAMADAIFGLLIALAALAAASLARRPGWPRAVLLGALLGLGGATKLSPLATALGLALAGAALFAAALVRERPDVRQARRFATLGLLVLVTALALFVAVYPYLWLDPLGRTRILFEFRSIEMATQAADWPVMAVPTRLEALQRVALNFTERFNLIDAISDWVFGAPAPLPLRAAEFVVAATGIAVMTAGAIRAGLSSPRMLALAVLGGQVAVTILGMRSEFDRYHLPMALLGAVSATVMLEWSAATALSAIRMRRAGLPSPSIPRRRSLVLLAEDTSAADKQGE